MYFKWKWYLNIVGRACTGAGGCGAPSLPQGDIRRGDCPTSCSSWVSRGNINLANFVQRGRSQSHHNCLQNFPYDIFVLQPSLGGLCPPPLWAILVPPPPPTLRVGKHFSVGGLKKSGSSEIPIISDGPHEKFCAHASLWMFVRNKWIHFLMEELKISVVWRVAHRSFE